MSFNKYLLSSYELKPIFEMFIVKKFLTRTPDCFELRIGSSVFFETCFILFVFDVAMSVNME